MRSEHHSRNGFLTSRGLREVAQRSLEGLEVDAMEVSRYLDSRVSVSGVRRDEIMEDIVYDPEHIELNRRFIHGS